MHTIEPAYENYLSANLFNVVDERLLVLFAHFMDGQCLHGLNIELIGSKLVRSLFQSLILSGVLCVNHETFKCILKRALLSIVEMRGQHALNRHPVCFPVSQGHETSLLHSCLAIC